MSSLKSALFLPENCGYEPSKSARGGFGALLLAAYDRDELRYVGSVGTGFEERPSVALRDYEGQATMASQAAAGSLFGQTSGGVGAAGQWTPDQKLRHALYKGLRERQDNADVYRIEEDDGV